MLKFRDVIKMFEKVTRLFLVAHRLPAATSSLEFTSLGPDVRFSMRVRHTGCETKVFHSFTSISPSCEISKQNLY